MSNNPKHIARPATPAVKPLTEDEKAQQIARFLSQKREQFFQGILFNLLHSVQVVTPDLSQFVDAAIAAADYAIEKLYPLPKEPQKVDKDEA